MKALIATVAALILAGVVFFPRGTPELPTTPLDPDELVATISHGQSIELAGHLPLGKWTVVEFTADW